MLEYIDIIGIITRFGKGLYNGWKRLTQSQSIVEDYSNLKGHWFLYHYTKDRQRSEQPILVSSSISLSIKRRTLVEGTEKVNVNHRLGLEYSLQGEVRAGILYLYCLCKQDASEFYAGMFINLLDENIPGLIMARDYDRQLYVSPALLSRSQKDDGVVERHLGEIHFGIYKPYSNTNET